MRKSIFILVLVILSMLVISCNKPVPLKIKTPVVTPIGGTYIQAQNVTITCETAEAQIRYTLDGSEPSSSSSLYTGAINISSSATLTAKAFKTGWTDSDAVSQVYTITKKVQSPVVTPIGGTYIQAQNVTITCETPGAEIRYTLDETDPSTSSTLYTGAINISSSATLTAKAFKEGLDDSETVTHKYDLSFQLKLSKTFGGIDYDYILNTIQTSDGGYIAVGSTRSNDGDISGNHGNEDGWIIKVDSNGNKVWSKCLGGSGDDSFFKIIETADGGFMIVGVTIATSGDFTSNGSSFNGLMIKLSSTGEKVWAKTFGGSYTDYLWDVVQTADNGYIAVGYTSSSDGDIQGFQGINDGWIIKVDSNGNKLWSKTFGGTSGDFLYGIVKTSDDGYVAAGKTYSTGGDILDSHGKWDGWIIKINSIGEKVWSKCFGGSSTDYLNSIATTSDGGFIAVGETESNDGDLSGNHGQWDGWIIKINSTGQKVWAETYGESGKDYLTDVIQTSDGGYMASGYTLSTDGIFSDNHGGQDAWIVKINSTGNKTWSKCFGGTAEDRFKGIIKTSDNSYVAVGNTESSDGDLQVNLGRRDGWILKLE